jgi:hypothetical protein
MLVARKPQAPSIKVLVLGFVVLDDITLIIFLPSVFCYMYYNIIGSISQ